LFQHLSYVVPIPPLRSLVVCEWVRRNCEERDFAMQQHAQAVAGNVSSCCVDCPLSASRCGSFGFIDALS
jgi:hypothetical protein